MTTSIFISYRRDDSAGDTARVYDFLKREFGKYQIFMDIETIKPGENFVQIVEDAVSNCGVFLAMIGKNWASIANSKGQPRLLEPNDFVRLEVAAALRHNKPVIPVLIRGAQMPSSEALPEDLKSLVYRNAMDLSDRHFQSDMEMLADRIREILNIVEPSASHLSIEAGLPSVERKGTTTVVQLTNILGIETDVQVGSLLPANEHLSSIGNVVLEIAPEVFIGARLETFRRATRHQEDGYSVLFADGQRLTGKLAGTLVGTDQRRYNLPDLIEVALTSLPEISSMPYHGIPTSQTSTEAWVLQVTQPIEATYTVTNTGFLTRAWVGSGFPPGSGSEVNLTGKTFWILFNNQEVEVNLVDFEHLKFSRTSPAEIVVSTPKGTVTSALLVRDTHKRVTQHWYFTAKLLDCERHIALGQSTVFSLDRK